MLVNGADRKYVIIGNGIAGTTAAEQIRKADSHASIKLITNEPYSLYNRIALPPFLKQKINRQKVTIKNAAWHQERSIDLMLETTVTRVYPQSKEVHLHTGHVLPFDVLLVATGGRANPLPGAGNLENVFNFQTFDDAIGISEQIDRSTNAVVIGGSYISYELTEAFRSRGLNTTWLMRGPHFLRRVLEEEGGALVDRIADKHGVQIVHGVGIKELRGRDGKVSAVIASDGREFPAELVGVGVGITRNVDFLAGSGIETNLAVKTDEFLRSNLPDIFAAGDSAEYFDRYVGDHQVMGTWDNATNHGKVAGQNMVGGNVPYDEVPTYSTTLFHNRIMAFGATPESDSELESVIWLDQATESYRRLFFHGENLLGGVIIGQRKGFPKLIDMIQKRTPIARADREALLTLT
ncbi:MAG TPA: FAD-dependent oxidoreductase [Chloroflexota bacterium]|nr:FAD-dependent oxidoreductase [Chloroflexota bacterium]